MALAMFSVGGFYTAKLMNQSNLSDQMLENIEAISEGESTTVCCNSFFEHETCYKVKVVDNSGNVISVMEVKGRKC